MNVKKYINTELGIIFILVGVLLCVLTVAPSLGVPTTGAATGVNQTGATLHGTTDIAGVYWFEYSQTSAGMTMATEPISYGAGAAAVAYPDGIPFVSGNTQYFRFCRDGSCGNTLSFTLSTITTVPTSTYTTQYYKPFVAAKWNMSLMAPIVVSPYFDKFGYLIWAIFWGAILMAFWVRQEDITIPSFIYIVLFAILSLGDYLPSPFVVVGWIFLFICFGSILYTLFRGRKHG